MAHVVQQAVVDGLADVAHGPLGVGGRDDLVRAGRVLVGGEDADLPPRHLLFVDVHRLKMKMKRRGECFYYLIARRESWKALLRGRGVSECFII